MDRNRFAALTNDDDDEEEEEDAMAELPLTAERVEALGPAFGTLSFDDLDDDARSTISTASQISVIHSSHSSQRANERGVSTKQIQQAKLRGSVTLTVQLCADATADGLISDLHAWGSQIQEQFPGVEKGSPFLRGEQEQRAEIELSGSGGKGPAMKKYLKTLGFFNSKDQTRRMRFTQRSGQREIVVVEGQGHNSSVQIITVFSRDYSSGREEEMPKAGHDFVLNECIDLYNKPFQKLVEVRDDPDEAERLLKDFEYSEQREGEWFIGPYRLSQWPPNKPFLHLAAVYGRAQTVQRMIEAFGVDVNQPARDDANTALHLAGLWGHASTVSALLKLGANKSLRNKYKERPLETALAGQERWVMHGRADIPNQRLNPFKLCFTNEHPPTWDAMIRQLEEASLAAGPLDLATTGCEAGQAEDTEAKPAADEARGKGKDESTPGQVTSAERDAGVATARPQTADADGEPRRGRDKEEKPKEKSARS